ncbi:unnamed protein product, partial [Pleuronectes platessa]
HQSKYEFITSPPSFLSFIHSPGRSEESSATLLSDQETHPACKHVFVDVNLPDLAMGLILLVRSVVVSYFCLFLVFTLLNSMFRWLQSSRLRSEWFVSGCCGETPHTNNSQQLEDKCGGGSVSNSPWIQKAATMLPEEGHSETDTETQGPAETGERQVAELR